ncbi:MAG: hypothetical protein RLZZ305_1158 [Actinomycetota bacterium]
MSADRAGNRVKKLSAMVIAAATFAGLGVSPVRAAVHSFAKSYKMTATLKGAQNMTVLLVSAKGQTLASAKVTSANQKVTLKSSKVSTTKGATLQLVSGTSAAGKGAYFGPAVLGWSGTKSTTASKVTSKLKASSSTNISLGTLQIKKVTAQQGYAVALAKNKLADTTTAALAKASKGKPTGVGNYGKNQSVSSGDFTVSAAAVGDPCTPGTTDCGPDGRLLAPPTNNPGNTPTNNTVAGPAAGGGTLSESTDDLLGGDKDDDGIPNAFDVNDDGDAVVDSADSSTPAPKAAVENATQTNCSSVDFRIFTNFKATQPKFAGTINAYGTGAFKADLTNIASTITKSMSMVFQPIVSVCGSNVTKTELKGNGAPYAPADYVELRNTCNTGDYQWSIGQGKMCGGDVAKQYDFGSAYTFTGTDLPNGLHTFTVRVTTADGNSYEFTSSPGFVFVTHPMFFAWSTDGANFSTINYSQSVNGPDGAALVSEPNIAVSQSQTLWLRAYRPQRLAIDGETGSFYDLGGFYWVPDIPNAGVGQCDALKTTDTTMTNDTAIDETNKPYVTLQWAIGTKCFGVPPRNVPWVAGGSDFDIQVLPTGPGGNSAQKIRITLS